MSVVAPAFLRCSLLVAIFGVVGITKSNQSTVPDLNEVSQLSPLTEVNLATEDRVVGGIAALSGQLPWQASLRVRRGGRDFLCGGTMVAQDWVLTAAHCVENVTAAAQRQPPTLTLNDIDVRTGSLFVGRGGLEAQPTRIELMTERNALTKDFDVALLQVQIASSARPVVLPDATDSTGLDPLPTNTSLRVSGYGKDESGANALVLKYTDLAYFRRRQCASSQVYGPKFRSSMICAGSTDLRKDACGGDSGGPLVLLDPLDERRATLIGVVSAGARCADASRPGVYANVADPRIAMWIRKVLGI